MNTTEINRAYEAVILVHPDASEADQKNLFKKNKGIIEKENGEIHSLETWGKRFLGNPIKKISKANYFHTTFRANADAIAELERTMRINDQVLRFMHVRLKEGTDLSKHMEEFRQTITDANNRQKEYEAKERKKAERFAKKNN